MPTTRALPSLDCSLLNSSYAYRFEFLPHRQLLLDGVDETAGRILEDQALKHYQRAQQKVTARIVKNGFDPLLFQPLIVNEREDGTYAIGDGGGRYMAIQHYIDRNLLPYDVVLPCLVCAISPEDEPLWFVKLNREKLKLHAVDIFLAEAAGGGEAALDILAIAADQQVRIKNSGSSTRTIAAVEPLQQIYSWASGRNILARTLRLLNRCGWADAPRGLSGGVILGTALIVHRSLDQGLGDDWLPDAFRQSTPNAVFAEATHEVGIARGGTSAVIGKGIYRYLADVVNTHGRVDGYKGPARRGSKRWLDPLYYTEHQLPE